MTKKPQTKLVFEKRPDLTPYLIHLTKNTVADDQFSAFDNLVHILRTGSIWGSGQSGYIKGPHKAACFLDVPFAALKFILDKDNANPKRPRYEPYGVVISKRFGYKHGCRPVLYLSQDEERRMKVPRDYLWRVVRFDGTEAGQVNWIHEREWRCKGAFKLPTDAYAVLVKTANEAATLSREVVSHPKRFKCVPRSVIPIQVMCQGLPFLEE